MSQVACQPAYCWKFFTVIVMWLLLTTLATAQQPLDTCSARLQFLGQALRAYAAAHGGSLPADLSTLYTERYVPTELWAFWCPDDPVSPRTPAAIETTGSYELVAKRLDSSIDQPLLRERVARHHASPDQPPYRYVLLSNGQIMQESSASTAPLSPVTNGPDTPPTIQLASDAHTEWEPYETVSYRWTGADDTTPVSKLEYRTNFSLTGMSPWTRATQVILGRLRPGEHALEVWVRDAAGQVCREPMYLHFRVRPRNAIAHLEAAAVRGRAIAKPSGPPPLPQWHHLDSALRRVDIRTFDPEEAVIKTRCEGTDMTAAFDAQTDAGRFQPNQTGFAPLILERGFTWLHVMLYFELAPGQVRPDCTYELACEGRTLGKQIIPAVEGDSRILHLRIFTTSGTGFRAGQYRLRLTVGEKRVCDLHFAVANANPGIQERQPISRQVLTMTQCGVDKGGLEARAAGATPTDVLSLANSKAKPDS